MVKLVKRFYTSAPIKYYPYILRNINQDYTHCYHEIVDIGIYDLLKPPYQHPQSKLNKWLTIKYNGWKVVPDYPDIKGEFGKPSPYDNVIETQKLHKKYYNQKDPTLLPVIQSRFGDEDSLKDYIIWFKKEYGVVDKLAIGSVCKLNNKKKAIELVEIIREEFPESWLHLFGLKFHHMKGMYEIIDSYDTMAWTFPRTPNRPTTKNNNMRVEYFYEYMDYLNQYLTSEWGRVINI
jgi:hypothetical protein